MAFGITRDELRKWKASIDNGKIAFITHFWLDDRFPDMKTVTKVGCKDLGRLAEWGSGYGLKKSGFTSGKTAIPITIFWEINSCRFFGKKEAVSAFPLDPNQTRQLMMNCLIGLLFFITVGGAIAIFVNINDQVMVLEIP